MAARGKSRRMMTTGAGIVAVLLLSIEYGITWYAFYGDKIDRSFVFKGNMLVIALYACIVAVLIHLFGGFRVGYLRRAEQVYAFCLGLFITNIFTYFQISLISRYLVQVLPMVLLTVAEIGTALLWSIIAERIYYRKYPPRRMLLVYGGHSAEELIRKIDTYRAKYEICAIVNVNEGVTKIYDQIMQYDSVILSDVSADLRNELLKFCYGKSIRVYLTPKISDVIIRGGESVNLFDSPLVLCRNEGIPLPQSIIKRGADIICAALGMLMTLPLTLLIAASIYLEDRGGVFFTQDRVTLGGRVFRMLKFRSMVVDAEKNGAMHLGMENDPRITRVGRLLRATRLDELPQLWNILVGDMSLVGPRPERVELQELYSRQIPEFSFRLKVRGGLTGFAQVYGKYNTSAYDKLRMDLAYITGYSFFMDLKLLLMTLKIVFTKGSAEGFSEEKAERIARKEG